MKVIEKKLVTTVKIDRVVVELDREELLHIHELLGRSNRCYETWAMFDKLVQEEGNESN